MFWKVLWDILATIGLGSVIVALLFIVIVIIKTNKEDRKVFGKYFKRKDDDEWP